MGSIAEGAFQNFTGASLSGGTGKGKEHKLHSDVTDRHGCFGGVEWILNFQLQNTFAESNAHTIHRMQGRISALISDMSPHAKRSVRLKEPDGSCNKIGDPHNVRRFMHTRMQSTARDSFPVTAIEVVMAMPNPGGWIEYICIHLQTESMHMNGASHGNRKWTSYVPASIE